MTVYNIDILSGQDVSAEGRLERKDVWNVKWAEVCLSVCLSVCSCFTIFVELQCARLLVVCLLMLLLQLLFIALPAVTGALPSLL